MLLRGCIQQALQSTNVYWLPYRAAGGKEAHPTRSLMDRHAMLIMDMDEPWNHEALWPQATGVEKNKVCTLP